MRVLLIEFQCFQRCRLLTFERVCSRGPPTGYSIQLAEAQLHLASGQVRGQSNSVQQHQHHKATEQPTARSVATELSFAGQQTRVGKNDEFAGDEEEEKEEEEEEDAGARIRRRRGTMYPGHTAVATTTHMSSPPKAKLSEQVGEKARARTSAQLHTHRLTSHSEHTLIRSYTYAGELCDSPHVDVVTDTDR